MEDRAGSGMEDRTDGGTGSCESKNRVINRLTALSKSYTPEWRFNAEQPDIGSALALIFAEFMGDTITQFQRVLQKHKVEFFRQLGAEEMEAGASQGYMTFRLVNEKAPETALFAETGVEAEMEGGGKCLFVTKEEIWIFASSVDRDVYGGEEVLYIRFSSPVTDGLVSLLFLIEMTELADRRLRWKYMGQDGWESIAAEDRTGQMCRTGIVRLAGMSGMKESDFFDRSGYWLRVEKESGPPLPDGIQVYLNAVEVCAKTAGAAGNGKAFGKYKLTRTVGFISKIENPDVFYGGTKGESRECTMDRCGSRLKHGFRAVTPGDFESLAKEASGNILRVKCFTGYDKQGREALGAVTVVVLQRDYLDGRRYFYRMETEIMDYLDRAAGPAIVPGRNFFVTAPRFVWVDVNAELYTEEYGRVMGIQNEAVKAAEGFCDPATGGFDENGWEFGSIPEPYQIKNLFQSIPGVVYVKRVLLTVGIMDQGVISEIKLSELKGEPWVLPLSGRHHITVRVIDRIPGKGGC